MDNQLLVIAPFPSKSRTYDNSYSALSSFAKNKVTSMLTLDPNLHVTVLADQIPGSTNWSTNRLDVLRIWRRGTLVSYLRLFHECLKRSGCSEILIELEWGLLGRSPLVLGLFPLFLCALRLLGKRIFVVAHGISLDFLPLAPQLGLSSKSFRTAIFNIGIRMFYFFLVLFSQKVIVLEKYFSKLLNKSFHTDKAVFIPHGVDTSLAMVGKQQARKRLGIADDEFVIINFGFLNWYKGSDAIVDIFTKAVQSNSIDFQNVRLMIVGGESRIHDKDPHYQGYTAGIHKMAAKTDKINITGFIREEDIPYYYCACDAVVFPYRLFISSSGPLSLAFSYRKPILLSQNLRRYFESEDFSAELNKSGLNLDILLFPLTPFGLREKLKLFKNKRIIYKLQQFSEAMKNHRNWRRVSSRYLELLQKP